MVLVPFSERWASFFINTLLKLSLSVIILTFAFDLTVIPINTNNSSVSDELFVPFEGSFSSETHEVRLWTLTMLPFLSAANQCEESRSQPMEIHPKQDTAYFMCGSSLCNNTLGWCGSTSGGGELF